MKIGPGQKLGQLENLENLRNFEFLKIEFSNFPAEQNQKLENKETDNKISEIKLNYFIHSFYSFEFLIKKKYAFI